MSKITETYINRNNEEFHLFEFNSDRLYSPSEQREIKEKNYAYFAARKSDSDFAIKQSEISAAKASLPMTDDDYYQLKLKQDQEKKLQILLDQQREIEAEALHELELKDSSKPFVQISTTNPITFLNEFAIRCKQSYSLDEQTLSLGPILYSAVMLKRSKSG